MILFRIISIMLVQVVGDGHGEGGELGLFIHFWG
jgi:hypothetical protein